MVGDECEGEDTADEFLCMGLEQQLGLVRWMDGSYGCIARTRMLLQRLLCSYLGLALIIHILLKLIHNIRPHGVLDTRHHIISAVH